MDHFHSGQIISLTIHGLGSSGEGVGYAPNGYTVFVDGVLPGEEIEARLFECHKRYARAHLLSISTPSPHRTTPTCPLFGKCGGCQLMHLAYPQQLEMKRQRIVDALQRIGKFDDCEVSPCLPSPSPLAYRNKIQLPVKKENKGITFGLYSRSSHDLVEVDNCQIHCSLGEEIYREVRAIIKRSPITAYESSTGKGELRHLLIKSAVNTQEALVILVTNHETSLHLPTIAKEIMSRNSAIKGVVHNIQQMRNNVILGNVYKVLEGVGYIHERLSDLTFKISSASFFQVNPHQAEHLYTKALEYAELGFQETVLDAYCGVGTLSLFFAKCAKQVIGVECVPEAIQDAQENARLNHIDNASFVCASSETFIASLAAVDVVLLNPPRKGCAPSLLEEIARLSPKTVIYISCDPATLARDLSHLCRLGYKITAVQPYDMFPQTAHVECIVKLELKGRN
jgi:23S rRNA (uracil1939-C5)-methyltransferase